MTGRVILVTGVGRQLGARVAAALLDTAGVERVIGIDSRLPGGAHQLPPGVEFVRADIRNPVVGKVFAAAGVDTVVHLGVYPTVREAGGRSAMKELNIIGSMQLLGACQRAPSLERVVLQSTTQVYGASERDPALRAESDEPRQPPRNGYGNDAGEVEGYLRGLGRRRPDVALTVLRLADLVGRGVDTPLTRYLALRPVPTVLGFDPRIQLLHEDDATEILRRAAVGTPTGTFHVAADGVAYLSQLLRRAGAVPLPLPRPLATAVGGALTRLRVAEYSVADIGYLSYGRVVDSTAVRRAFDWRPRWTTAEAFEQFAAARIRPVLPAPVVASAVDGAQLALAAISGVVGR